MDLETVSPVALGQSLRGVGLNILTRDVIGLARALSTVLGLPAHRVSADFALLSHGSQLIQIHADAAFANHPLASLAAEAAPRGAGVQIYLFGLDPDGVAERARIAGDGAGITLIEEPADKPHGLREATVLTREGYAFTAASARPLASS
jgi:hypothetical protein